MESRPGLNHRACQFELRLRFSDFAEPSGRPPLFFQGLQKQPCFVRPVEAAGEDSGTAVTGDFVVLEPLRQADHDCIARIVCRAFIQSLVCFLNNARKPSRMSRVGLAAPVRENELEPLDVEPRFVAVARQSLAQSQASRGIA